MLYFSEQRTIVAIVFTHEFADLFQIRTNIEHANGRPRLHPHIRIFNRRLVPEHAKFGARESFDDVQRIGMCATRISVLSLKPIESTTSVSPSQRPMELPCHV